MPAREAGQAASSDKTTAESAPLAPRLFYGWVIVVAFALISSLAISMAAVNFGFFIRPMSDELGIRESFFGWASSARLLGSASAAYFIGRLVDRYGARVPLVVAALCAGLIVAGLSRVSAGWHLVGLFFLLGVTGLQGGGGDLYAGVSIAKWFVRERGRAMSIAFLGAPAGIFAFTPLTQFLISAYGWQTAFLVLGLCGGGLIMGIAIAAVRRQPEDLGQLPDGARQLRTEPDAPRRTARREELVEHSWTRPEALRSGTFWRLAVGFGAMMFSLSSVAMFRVPHFVERGIDAQLIAFAISSEAVSSALVAFPVGLALDRFEPRHVAAVAFALLGSALLATMLATTTWQMFLAMILFGFGIASLVILQNSIWPIYFGAAHIGSIRGAALPLTLAFGMAGAPLAGAVKDATGSYLPIWWVALAGLVFAAALMFSTRRPEVRPR